MLAPQQKPRRMPQRLLHATTTLPPPSGGLNTTSDIADMPPTDALEMDNVVANEFGLTVRGGWFEYATGIDAGNEIRTVMAFNGSPPNALVSPLASSVLFASTDHGIYNIEGGGNLSALAPAKALSGSSGAGFIYKTMFTAAGGAQYLVCCSETDGAMIYDGVSWTVPAITGVSPADLVYVVTWKKRLLFVRRNSSSMWILPVGAIAGAAVQFDFGPQFMNGGSLLALASWTQDDGAGIDDRLVIVSSNGDLLVYEGTDPTNAALFQNDGVWFIGQPPLGRRGITTSGGNVFVLTLYGLVPVAQVVQGGLDTILTSDTDKLKQLRKLQSALNSDFTSLLNVTGWELHEFPAQALIVITRPLVAIGENIQYAFQMHNLAWSIMRDIPGVTFGRRLNEVYCGTADGRVLRCFSGDTDGMLLDGTGAHEIRSRVTPAFNFFGNPAVLKQALMLRPQFLADASPAFNVLMNVDFEQNPISLTPAAGSTTGALWDHGHWDVDRWAGGKASFGEWRSVVGMGYSLSPTLYISTSSPTTLCSIEHMVKQGGPL